MANKNPAGFGDITPGDLYREIAVPGADFKQTDKYLKRKIAPPFVAFCRNINKRFPGLGKGAKFKENYKDAVEFMGWDLTAEEFSAATKFVLIASIGVGLLISIGILYSPLASAFMASLGYMAYIYVFMIPVAIALYLTNVVQGYPKNAVKIEQTRALTYVPEIVGYMIMSMKLVPNLEKAVEFSAEHGRGKIAEDFKKIIWDVQVGIYSSLSEAIDDLAYRWGKYSEEFKHAMMMIRASVLEPTEAKRYALLDKTMLTILESIKDKMEQYARSLTTPSVMLFYLGVLLPLILIIILPVGSAFAASAMATAPVLIFIYNIGIPAGIFLFSKNLIKKRPPTYTPPVIEDNYPGLPPKWTVAGRRFLDVRVLIAIVLIAGLAGSFFLSVQGIPPKFLLQEGDMQILPADKDRDQVLMQVYGSTTYFDEGGELFRTKLGQCEGDADCARKAVFLEETQFFMKSENDVTKYNLIFGMLLTGSIAIYLFLYHTNIHKRRVQQQIMKMETEFKDSLYILASRLGENKPVEEALAHTRDFLPGFDISKRVFGKTVDNIRLLGLPLEAALFDPKYGSLKNIPSNIIQSAMKILVDSVQLGVNVAARTLISLSLQLSNSEKVIKMLNTLVADTTSMMQSMAVFIAPVVLGVTTSLHKVVINTLASISAQTIFETAEEGGAGTFGGLQRIGDAFANPEIFRDIASPAIFVVIVAVYVIELVLIMTYFTTKIQEDNDLLTKINIAKALPIAMAVFIISTIGANLVIGGFFTG